MSLSLKMSDTRVYAAIRATLDSPAERRRFASQATPVTPVIIYIIYYMYYIYCKPEESRRRDPGHVPQKFKPQTPNSSSSLLSLQVLDGP